MFKRGDLIGWYTGRRVAADAEGDYVVSLGPPWDCGVDGAARGTVLRYMNSSKLADEVCARFGSQGVHVNAAGRLMVPVYATRAVHAHDELVAYYSRGFRFE